MRTLLERIQRACAAIGESDCECRGHIRIATGGCTPRPTSYISANATATTRATTPCGAQPISTANRLVHVHPTAGPITAETAAAQRASTAAITTTDVPTTCASTTAADLASGRYGR
jgi:hypothetical protein